MKFFAALLTLLLCSLALASRQLVAPAVTERIFYNVSIEEVVSGCELAYKPEQPKIGSTKNSAPLFLAENQQPQDNQSVVEAHHLLSELQQTVLHHQVNFDFEATNASLFHIRNRPLLRSEAARARLCQPVYNLWTFSTSHSVPNHVLNVTCGDGCVPVMRSIPVYTQLCVNAASASTGGKSWSVAYKLSQLDVGVDCKPAKPISLLHQFR